MDGALPSVSKKQAHHSFGTLDVPKTPLVRRGVLPPNTTAGLSFDLADPQDLVIGDRDLADTSPLALGGRLRRDLPDIGHVAISADGGDDDSPNTEAVTRPPAGRLELPLVDQEVSSRPPSPSTSASARWRVIRNHVRTRPRPQDRPDVSGARGKLALLRVLGVQRQQQSVKAAVLAAGAAVPKTRGRHFARRVTSPASDGTASAPVSQSSSISSTSGTRHVASATVLSADPPHQPLSPRSVLPFNQRSDAPSGEDSGAPSHSGQARRSTPEPSKAAQSSFALGEASAASDLPQGRAVAFKSRSVSRSQDSRATDAVPEPSPRRSPTRASGADSSDGPGSDSLEGFTLGLARKRKSSRVRWRKRLRSIYHGCKRFTILTFIAFLLFCCADASIRSMSRHEVFILFQAILLYVGLMLPVWLTLLIFLYKGKLYRECAGIFRRRDYAAPFTQHHEPHSQPMWGSRPFMERAPSAGAGGREVGGAGLSTGQQLSNHLESLASDPDQRDAATVRRAFSRPMMVTRQERTRGGGASPMNDRPAGLSGSAINFVAGEAQGGVDASSQWHNRPLFGIRRFVTMPNITAALAVRQDPTPEEAQIGEGQPLELGIPIKSRQAAAFSGSPMPGHDTDLTSYPGKGRLTSDADLIFFNWTTQKQQMRQRHLAPARLLSSDILADITYAVAPPGRDQQPFAVPSAVTTGQLLPTTSRNAAVPMHPRLAMHDAPGRRSVFSEDASPLAFARYAQLPSSPPGRGGLAYRTGALDPFGTSRFPPYRGGATGNFAYVVHDRGPGVGFGAPDSQPRGGSMTAQTFGVRDRSRSQESAAAAAIDLRVAEKEKTFAVSRNARFRHRVGMGQILCKRHQRRRLSPTSNSLAYRRPKGPRAQCKSVFQRAYASMLIPRRMAVFLHDFPAFQISLILRNLAWCAIYIWATTLITRTSTDQTWDTTQMPVSFWNWENCFMWMITWDYIVLFLASQDRWRYTLSFESLIDLLTMPPAKVIVSWIDRDYSEQYTIYSGSLRFLRLVRVESILTQVVPWISQVKLKLISLVVASSVITLMFACTMFTLEAPYSDREGFNSVYGFVFFAVVTISTVGYGDFAPKKQISRAIVMVAIIATLAMLPNQIQKLVTALQTPPRIIGRIPAEHHGYIVFAGPIDPKQLALICRELACALPGSCSHILIITPDTVQKYTSVIRYAFIRGGIRVTALQGDFTPLHTRPLYRRARAILIVGNTRSAVDTLKNLNTSDERGDLDALQLDDDHQTILRFLGAQHICWPDRPTCVQLTDGTAKLLVTEMGAYHVVCLQHIKMKLMAKSCAGCPGFITIVTNLFHQPSLEVQGDAFNDDEGASSRTPRRSTEESSGSGVVAAYKGRRYTTTYLYARGCGYQIYRLEFPECFYGEDKSPRSSEPVSEGISYALLVRILLMEYEVYLLGVCCISKEFWLNPVGFHIGDELDRFTDWPFAGIVASPSLRIVQEVRSLSPGIVDVSINPRQISRLKDLVITKETKSAADHTLRRLRRSKVVIQKRYEAFVSSRRTETSPATLETETQPKDAQKGNLGDKDGPSRPKERSVSLIEGSPDAESGHEQGAHTTASAAVLPVGMFGAGRDVRGLSPITEAGMGILDSVCDTPYGIKEVADVDAAIHNVFSRSRSPLLLICGWPRGLVVFLAALQASCRSNVVILAPGCPAGMSNDALLAFKDTCAWVRGSAADVADLLRAGALEANSCAVFSTTQVPWKKNVKKHRTDTQAILVREFIYAIHNSDALLEKRLNHLVRSKFRRVQWRAEDLLHTEVNAPTSQPGSRDGNRGRDDLLTASLAQQAAPLVVLELQNESNIDYLSVTSLPSAVSWTAKMEVDDLWVQEGLSIMNSEFAAGKVLLEEMLHGMIAYTLPVSRYCMDTRIIDHFVEGSHLPLPEGFPSRCPFWLEPIPDNLSRGTFGELFTAMLHERAKLAIGIYRTVRKSTNPTPLDLLQGPESTQYVVISCPPQDMPLMKDDNVYVILPCPVEALGLLFSPETTGTPEAPPPFAEQASEGLM